MAVQFLPIVKAVAPYLAQIATAAIPVFTSKSDTATKSDTVVAEQIKELQAAATQNAESLHVLAEKLQQTVQGIENAAEEAKKQVATYKTLLFVALGLSGISVLLSVVLLFR